MEAKLEKFRQHIDEGIQTLRATVKNRKLDADIYAFNYWVLVNIYGMDAEFAHENITEYADKSIDGYAYDEEDKTLYLIQGKFYGHETRLSFKEISDFTTRPIATLERGEHQNRSLQELYNKIKADKDCKIHLHMLVTSDSYNKQDVAYVAKARPELNFELSSLKDIHDLYYGVEASYWGRLTTRLKNVGVVAATVAVLLVSAAGLSIWLVPRGMDASTSMLDATPPPY